MTKRGAAAIFELFLVSQSSYHRHSIPCQGNHHLQELNSYLKNDVSILQYIDLTHHYNFN